jgi:hypothetical protein
MTSNTKVPTNKSTGGGPKTQAGKRHTRLNALREGFFSKELVLKEDEQSLSATIRLALQEQYAPSTPMQWIALDRIHFCLWRVKRAAQREMRRLSAQLDLQTPTGTLAEDPEEKAHPRWYALGRAELRDASRMLLELRQDIEASGWIHAEHWKEPITKTFDENFYDSLTEWDPGSIDAILMAEHLVAHSKTYNLPLPELEEVRKSEPAVGDPRSRWQMMVKLIDLKLQQLNDFRRLLDRRSDGGDSQTAASAEDGRYFASACRDLERAVAWYQYLQEQGL